MKKLVVTLLTALSLIVLAADAQSAEEQGPPASKSERKGPKHIPFHGKLEAVDKEAKTLRIGERTFEITPETKITKAAKPAQLDDAVIGEPVGGSYREAAPGHLQVLSLRLGPKVSKAEKAESKK